MIIQYGSSPVLNKLVENWRTTFSFEDDLKNFFDKVYNLETATTYGLNVWGTILNTSRIIFIPSYTATNPTFGFQGTGLQPFNQGIFYTGAQPYYFTLTDEQYRILLLFRFVGAFSNGSIAGLNRCLKTYFRDRGLIYVEPTAKMFYNIKSDFSLTANEILILTYTNALPIPSGVGISINE